MHHSSVVDEALRPGAGRIDHLARLHSGVVHRAVEDILAHDRDGGRRAWADRHRTEQGALRLARIRIPEECDVNANNRRQPQF